MLQFRLLIIAGMALLLSACASAIHDRQQTVTVTSVPAGARVTIYDANDAVVATDTTPFVALLNRGAGYFKPAKYRLEFAKDGHADAQVSLTPRVNGGYFANLFFGVFGLIGIIAVDPVTGAMYTLTPQDIEQPLTVVQ